MHYLIDGHNLIAQMSDIQLSDPDDEEQLVRRLRGWMAAGRKRRITLFFDGGLPGGRDPHISGGSLTVIFASVGRDADSLIIRRISKIRNAPEYTLVSSDRSIVAVARSRGMPVVDSHSFARAMEDEAQERGAAGIDLPTKENPMLDANDVARWLDIFGGEDEKKNK